MFTKNAIKPLQSSLSPSPPSPMLSPTPHPSPPQTSRWSPRQSVSHGSQLLTSSQPVELAGRLRLCGPCLALGGGHGHRWSLSFPRMGGGGMTRPWTHPWPCHAWCVAWPWSCWPPCRRSGTCPSRPSWQPKSIWGWPPGKYWPRGRRWPGWPAARWDRPSGLCPGRPSPPLRSGASCPQLHPWPWLLSAQ